MLVVGGGTAGALAALHAARGGARTVIIEQQYVLGGTSTVGGVSTYWFGNRYRDVREIDRETDRYMEWLGLPRRQGIWSDDDDFHPGVRAWVLQRLCLEAGVQIYYGQICYGAVCSEEAEGRRIHSVLTAVFSDLTQRSFWTPRVTAISRCMRERMPSTVPCGTALRIGLPWRSTQG